MDIFLETKIHIAIETIIEDMCTSIHVFFPSRRFWGIWRILNYKFKRTKHGLNFNNFDSVLWTVIWLSWLVMLTCTTSTDD